MERNLSFGSVRMEKEEGVEIIEMKSADLSERKVARKK